MSAFVLDEASSTPIFHLCAGLDLWGISRPRRGATRMAASGGAANEYDKR